MDVFLHPWYMAAGAALVSAPILIHLINRMRFKRLRWAAMEFLLKSQKKNRRRLIIEQLILLALRILLVLLVALLVARWLFGGENAKSGTLHVVVLDDSLSMQEAWEATQEGDTSAWVKARLRLAQLAKTAAQANSPQHMKIYLLSDLVQEKDPEPKFAEQLSDKSDEAIAKLLGKDASIQPTALHLSPLPGLQKAHELLRAAPHGQKVLHVVSDFRVTDWEAGRDA